MLQLLNSLIGDSKIMQAGVIFAVVVAIALTLIIVFRMIFQSRVHSVATGGKASRLAVVDVFDLDRNRQLVLVRRDQVEHLVMIGGPNDLVVETGIVRTAIPTREKERTGDKDSGQSPPVMPVQIDSRIQKAIEVRSSEPAVTNIVEVKTSEMKIKPEEVKPRPASLSAPAPAVPASAVSAPAVSARTVSDPAASVRPVVGYAVKPPDALKASLPEEVGAVVVPPDVKPANKVQAAQIKPDASQDKAETTHVHPQIPPVDSVQIEAAPAMPETVAATAPEVVVPREDTALPTRRPGSRTASGTLAPEDSLSDPNALKTVPDKPTEPREDSQKVFDRTPFISRPVPQPRTLTPLSARQPSGAMPTSLPSRPVTPPKPNEQKRPQIALQPVAPPLPEAEPQGQAADVLLPIDELELEMARLLGRPVKLD